MICVQYSLGTDGTEKPACERMRARRRKLAAMREEQENLQQLFKDDAEMLALIEQVDRQSAAHAEKFPRKEQSTNDGPQPRSKAAGRRHAAHGKRREILLNILVYGFCAALIIGAALFALSDNPHKSYFGYRLYSVLTDSMTPQEGGPSGGFYKGDLILVKLVDPTTIQVGDIITYMTGSDQASYLTHRVREIKTELNGKQGLYFITRGDTNNTDDPPVESSMVVGKKMYTIPKIGFAIAELREHLGLVLVVFFLVFGVVLTARFLLHRASPGSGEPAPAQQNPPVRQNRKIKKEV